MTVDQPKDGKAFYPALDLLRFAAAALVMLNHLRVNQFDSFSKVACESSALKTAFFSATRVGLEAVVVFLCWAGFWWGACPWRVVGKACHPAQLLPAAIYLKEALLILM